MGKSVTLARKVVESWDWTQNVYFHETNNFAEEGVSVIPLVFKIIGIIGLIESRYLAIALKYQLLIRRSQRAKIKPIRSILIS